MDIGKQPKDYKVTKLYVVACNMVSILFTFCFSILMRWIEKNVKSI